MDGTSRLGCIRTRPFGLGLGLGGAAADYWGGDRPIGLLGLVAAAQITIRVIVMSDERAKRPRSCRPERLRKVAGNSPGCVRVCPIDGAGLRLLCILSGRRRRSDGVC